MTLAQQLTAVADVLDDVAPIIDRPLLENGVPNPGAILREAAQRLQVTNPLSVEEALAELVSLYAKSGGKGGTLSLEEINEAMRSQIQANEESGEE